MFGLAPTLTLSLPPRRRNGTQAGCHTYSLLPTAGHKWPRLAELVFEDGMDDVVTPEVDCAADPFSQLRAWRVSPCTRLPLVPPPPSPAEALAGTSSILLAVATSSAPLLEQVSMILHQLHAAHERGLLPAAFLGANPFAPADCSRARRRGKDNRWDWFFAPVSGYRLGARTVRGQPVRIFVASPADTLYPPAMAEDGATVEGIPPTVSLTSQTVDDPSRMRQLVLMSRMTRLYLRVHSSLLRMTHRLLWPLRARAATLLGVHLSAAMKPSELDVVNTLVSQFLRAGGAGTASHVVMLIGASAEVYAVFVQRHGRERVTTPMAACSRRRAECDGRRDVIDALLLAHTDFLVTTSLDHPCPRFALWYNSRLHHAHLQLSIPGPAAGLDALPAASRPAWAGGAWQPAEGGKQHATAMLAALRGDTRRGGGGIGDESATEAFLPGLPPPVRKVPTAAETSTPITKGTCKAAGARRMTFGECQAFAVADKKHFLGASTDVNEYPGCTLWLDTLLVEFNDHSTEGGGCNHGGRGKCVCMKA